MQTTQVIVVTTGSAGDLFPFLRLALALRERGCTVQFVAPALHAEAVQRTGLPFHGTWADPAVLDHPDLWHPRKGFAIVWKAVLPGLRELPALIAALPPSVPCILIAHPLAIPHADLCRAIHARLAVVEAYLAPSNLPTVYDPLVLGPWPVPRWVPKGVRRWLWRRIGALVDPIVLPDINSDRAALGLEPARHLFEHLRDAPDLSVTLFPEWFGPRQPDWPSAMVQGDFTLYDPNPGAELSAELKSFLAAGDAPIVFTHGTGNRQAAAYFRSAVQACALLGRRAIVLTTHRDQLAPELPPYVLWQDYLPLVKLLPHVAALVHHGGIGTTAEALRAGVPQLVVPMAFDQFDNGARVLALGAGQVLPSARVSAPRLARELERLLDDPTMHQRCATLRITMNGAPALGHLVDSITRLAHTICSVADKRVNTRL